MANSEITLYGGDWDDSSYVSTVDYDSDGDVSTINYEKDYPLHNAILKNDIKDVKYVLGDFSYNTYHFNVNKYDNDGDTPLHIAVQKGNIEIVKLLLADKNISIC